MSGGKSADKRKETLNYKGRTCITNKAKANAFCQHYAEISGRRKKGAPAKELRRAAVEVDREVKAERPGTPVENEFSMGELLAAINKIKPRKAAGPDELKSDYIIRMSASARGILIQIFNHSWTQCWVSQAWRSAVIIQGEKPGTGCQL